MHRFYQAYYFLNAILIELRSLKNQKNQFSNIKLLILVVCSDLLWKTQGYGRGSGPFSLEAEAKNDPSALLGKYSVYLFSK